MSSRYHGHWSQPIRNSMRFLIGPDLDKTYVNLELERWHGSEHDPEKPPPPEDGDKYILIGVSIGKIIGGSMGGIISFIVNWHLFAILLSVLVGIIIGGILGAIIGSRIKTRVLKKELEPKQKFK